MVFAAPGIEAAPRIEAAAPDRAGRAEQGLEEIAVVRLTPAARVRRR